jgi:uncharacterized protein (TIGR00369 family)
MIEQEIINDWPGHCFGCSPKNPYGLQLHFWRSEDGCYTKCIIPEHLCGWDGLVHGGIIATLLDEIGGWAIISKIGKIGMTARSSVSYLKPVPTGQELTIRGEIIKHRRNLAVIQATIHSDDGELLAECESKWLIPNPAELKEATGMDKAVLQDFLEKASTETT